MRQIIPLNNDWMFAESFSDELLTAGSVAGARNVRIPHTVKETPFHYFDESVYQMESGYRHIINALEEWRGRRVFARFEAVAHSAYVYMNGTRLAEHHNGYTAFEAELTETLRYGEDNVLAVRVDSREDQDIPPFGNVIDYMTYGGIYREVSLVITDRIRISDVDVMPQTPEDMDPYEGIREGFDGSVNLTIALDDGTGEDISEDVLKEISFKYTVKDHVNGDIVSEGVLEYDDLMDFDISAVRLWDVTSPQLYDLHLELVRGGEALDDTDVTFGFRTAEFKKDGFYLNGRWMKIRGLNRHQSYPYVGYAMPASMQKLDADILRRELGLNAVRTSHYPQSQHFINRCDELGLLVFTEIPGWQHIGGDAWKEQVLINVEEMIVQYRNHPSIILWGVRINESQDDDELYLRTNDLARCLDSTRQTGGVRFIEKSSLLEDVYTFNDFSHDGVTPGCRKKEAVTPDPDKPYLISEYAGHMYPTKAYDSEEHRLSHALRHAATLDAVNRQRGISGSFGWCMFDYNTHGDFGSGDRVCYHGVMDMFRNPKLAAYLYASQQNVRPVLKVSSTMDIGEHPGGNKGDVYIFTNADSVRMYKNDEFIKEYFPTGGKYKALRHPPIVVDDYVGELMQEKEGFTPHQNAIVKEALNYIGRYGMTRMPVDIKLKLAEAMTVYKMPFSEAYRLYGEYVGDWGGKAKEYRFDAIKDGETVKSVTCGQVKDIHIQTDVSATALKEGGAYDVASVRIRVCDQHGNIAPFFNTLLPVATQGPIELIGPSNVWISGGMGGTYVRTTGETGAASITISLPEGYPQDEDSKAVISFLISQ